MNNRQPEFMKYWWRALGDSVSELIIFIWFWLGWLFVVTYTEILILPTIIFMGGDILIHNRIIDNSVVYMKRHGFTI